MNYRPHSQSWTIRIVEGAPTLTACAFLSWTIRIAEGRTWGATGGHRAITLIEQLYLLVLLACIAPSGRRWISGKPPPPFLGGSIADLG